MAQVILLCSSHSWGGLEQVAAQDARLLSESGVEVVAVGMRESPFVRELSGAIRVVPLDYEPRNLADLRLIRDLRALLAQGASAMVVHQPSLLGSVVPALWGYPRARLLVFRHIWSDHRKLGPYHRWLFARVTRLLVVSESIRRNVLDTHAIASEKVGILRLGVDLSRFDPRQVDRAAARARWSLAADDWVVGVVGRLDPGKGQAELMEAFGLARARARDFSKWRLLVVGEETRGAPAGYLARLQARVAELGLVEQVRFAGFTPDVPAAMAAADLCAMPSREEAFGLVAIEALAMGCPVLISEGGSASEIAREFGSERVGLAKPLDPASLAEQLLAREGASRGERPAKLQEYSRDARRRALRALL